MATLERTYYLQVRIVILYTVILPKKADTVEEMKMWVSGFEKVMKFKQLTKDNSWIREIEMDEVLCALLR